MLSEFGTYKTVKARVWPWLSGKSSPILLSCSLFARQRQGYLRRERYQDSENGSSQGHNLALTGLCVPSSLDSGASMRWSANPQSGIKSPFPGPRFVLALAEIRRPVVQIKAVDKDDLVDTRTRRSARTRSLPEPRIHRTSHARRHTIHLYLRQVYIR